jgi:hypothetical protein
MSDHYTPERRARDLERMKHPDTWPWPNLRICLKRWKGDCMEFGTLGYANGRFTFHDEAGRLCKGPAGKELCDELVLAGWVAD